MGGKALSPDVGADQGIVLLLDEAVVILLPGTATGELRASELVGKETLQVIVHELRPIV